MPDLPARRTPVHDMTIAPEVHRLRVAAHPPKESENPVLSVEPYRFDFFSYRGQAKGGAINAPKAPKDTPAEIGKGGSKGQGQGKGDNGKGDNGKGSKGQAPKAPHTQIAKAPKHPALPPVTYLAPNAHRGHH